MSVDRAFKKQLEGWRLATAEILYHLPDHPGILQSYIWQDYDLAPAYPALRKFLHFWRHELEGPVHSVRVAGKKTISPSELRSADFFALV